MLNFHTHTVQPNAICNMDDKDVELNPQFFYSVGNHPWTNLFSKVELECVVAENNNVIAIGECGIDKLKSNKTLVEQIDIFKQQVVLSEKLDLPIILHVVKGFDEIIKLKKELKPNQKWVVHGFNKYKMMNQLIDAGLYLSFGASVLNNKELQIALIETPMNKIFLETDDSEYNIEKIYTFVADLMNIELNQLETQINHNFKTITNGRLAGKI